MELAGGSAGLFRVSENGSHVVAGAEASGDWQDIAPSLCLQSFSLWSLWMGWFGLPHNMVAQGSGRSVLHNASVSRVTSEVWQHHLHCIHCQELSHQPAQVQGDGELDSAP